MKTNSGIDLVDTIYDSILDTLLRIPLGVFLVILGCYLGMLTVQVTEVCSSLWLQHATPDWKSVLLDILWAPQVVFTTMWGLILAPICFFGILLLTHSTNSRVVQNFCLIASWGAITALCELNTDISPLWGLAITLPILFLPAALIARHLYQKEMLQHAEYTEALQEQIIQHSRSFIENIQTEQQAHQPHEASSQSKPHVPPPSPGQDYSLKPKKQRNQAISTASPVLSTYKDKATPPQTPPQSAETRKNPSHAVRVKLNPTTKAAITRCTKLSRQQQTTTPPSDRPEVPLPEPDLQKKT